MATVTVTALCAGPRRRQAIHNENITPHSITSAVNLHRALRIAHAHLLPGEHLEADVYADGTCVGSWRVTPFGRLPEEMVDVIRQHRQWQFATEGAV